ncbi:MAG: hypothetical protein MJZ02_10415, partial [Paludibacteraceae bacterium]|nr:hypothetical protein [Paludibacteraceae bacterium]
QTTVLPSVSAKRHTMASALMPMCYNQTYNDKGYLLGCLYCFCTTPIHSFQISVADDFSDVRELLTNNPSLEFQLCYRPCRK